MSVHVSICIPAYRQPEFLRRTLQSVFRQSMTDYEVIITDDSPDHSVRHLLHEFSSDKIRYYPNQQPKGSPENWNYAVSLAAGELIKILHHDDWFSGQDSLSRFVEMLEQNPKADFAFSASRVCDAQGNSRYIYRPPRKSVRQAVKNPSALYGANIIGAPSATIYRRTIKNTFDAKLKWIVDIDFYFSVLSSLASRHKVRYSQAPLVCTTDGAAHQVTNECLDNKEIELFEWLYFAAKIESRGVRWNWPQQTFVCEMLRKHGIHDRAELEHFYGSKPLPKIAQQALQLNRLLPRRFSMTAPAPLFLLRHKLFRLFNLSQK